MCFSCVCGGKEDASCSYERHILGYKGRILLLFGEQKDVRK